MPREIELPGLEEHLRDLKERASTQPGEPFTEFRFGPRETLNKPSVLELRAQDGEELRVSFYACGPVRATREEAELDVRDFELWTGKAIRPEEVLVLNEFAQAYRSLRQLPNFDNACDSELAAALHVFQDFIAVRVARRVNPEFWRAAR